MGTISRVTTWSTGDTLTASDLNGEFDNILSTANGSINADNLGVTAGQASASKAIVLDSNKDFANVTGSNQIRNLTISGSLKIGTTFLPDAAGGADLGSTSLEWGDVYVADDKYLYMGSDQNIKIGYDETTTDSLAISAIEGAGLAITLRADEGDDAGDEWKLNVADGGVVTFGNDIASAGTFVTHLTLTPHATVSSSTLALAGALTVAGTAGITGVATVGGLTIGSAVINEAELETIDGITAGTVAASKAVVVDSNKDIGTFRNITLNGTLSDGNYTFDTSGNVTGLGTVGSGAITSTGVVTGTGFTIGSAVINEAELETIDGVTAGTVAASKAVVVDSNKDIASFRNVTLTGELDAATGDFSGDVDIDGTTNLDAVDIDGAVQVDATITVGADDQGYDVKFFGDTASAYLLWDTSADKLLTAGGTTIDIVKDKLLIGSTAVTTTAAELNVLDAVSAGTVTASLAVVVDSNKDIGSFRNITLTGELDAGSLDISGDADIDGTANLDAVDIDGAVQIDNTVTVGVNGTGYDVQFFGDTAGSSVLWDQSADDLILTNAGLAVGSDATGDVYYRDANGFLARLGIGSDGQVLTSTGTLPNWEAAGAGGSFSGPGSSTDNAVVRFNGTGGATGQNSGLIVVDSNNVTGAANVTLSGELDAATGDFSGIIDVAGAATLASLVCTAGGTFGGGYGSTGATISTAGVGQFNGALTTDGALTASGDISFDGGAFVFNEAGADKDFRIEGDAQANLFFVDASVDTINLRSTASANTASGAQTLGIHGEAAFYRQEDNAYGRSLTFVKSRGSGAEKTVDNDDLGYLSWASGDDGDLVTLGAQIKAEINGTPASNNVPCDMVFYTNAGSASLTEELRILKSGGITFNGDTATANALDDYEEGTWTAAFNCNSGSVGINASYNLCSYTKIGHRVFVQGAIIVGSVSSPSGWLTITGLPFTPNAGGSEYEFRYSGTVAPWAISGTPSALSLVGFPNITYLGVEDNPGVNAEADHMQVGAELRISASFSVA